MARTLQRDVGEVGQGKPGSALVDLPGLQLPPPDRGHLKIDNLR